MGFKKRTYHLQLVQQLSKPEEVQMLNPICILLRSNTFLPTRERERESTGLEIWNTLLKYNATRGKKTEQVFFYPRFQLFVLFNSVKSIKEEFHLLVPIYYSSNKLVIKHLRKQFNPQLSLTREE